MKDVKDIAKELLPIIRKGIEMYGKAVIRIADIEKEYGTITPDKFCKIAGALTEFGIVTDIGATIHDSELAMTFSLPEKPSLEECEEMWEIAKSIIKERI